MKTLMRAAAMALLLSTAAAPGLAQAPVAAESLYRTTTLNLSAYGEVKATPDKAMISLGVVTDGKTAAEAMQANAQRMDGVMAALRRGGIAARDIQTSQLTLSPQYRYRENEAPLLTGYQASNMVTVTVRDLARLGQAVDTTVNAGANQVHGISFGLESSAAAEDAAREAAVRSLQHKAELYARATGHRISRLISLSEGGGSYVMPPPPPPMAPMAMERMGKVASAVSPGELNVRVDINGLYELAR